MQKTFQLLTIFTLLLPCYYLHSQKPDFSKFTFYTEVVPYSVLYGGRADGFQVGVGYALTNKHKLLLTYGTNKLTYKLSDDPGTVNGIPIADKTTDATILMPRAWRVGGIPDQSLYELLEEAGIKHYEPRDGAYVTNYATLEWIRSHQFKDKWDFEWGFGAQFGLMNRNEVGGSLTDSVNYFGVPIKTLINIRISARYLYYGLTNRITFTRKISDHFSVGISSGLHVIMAKNSIDDLKPYVGLLALCRI
jgi:hypothetical protein